MIISCTPQCQSFEHVTFLRRLPVCTPQAEFSKSWSCSCVGPHLAHRKQSSANHDHVPAYAHISAHHEQSSANHDHVPAHAHTLHATTRVQQIMIMCCGVTMVRAQTKHMIVFGCCGRATTSQPALAAVQEVLGAPGHRGVAKASGCTPRYPPAFIPCRPRCSPCNVKPSRPMCVKFSRPPASRYVPLSRSTETVHYQVLVCLALSSSLVRQA